MFIVWGEAELKEDGQVEDAEGGQLQMLLGPELRHS